MSERIRGGCVMRYTNRRLHYFTSTTAVRDSNDAGLTERTRWQYCLKLSGRYS